MVPDRVEVIDLTDDASSTEDEGSDTAMEVVQESALLSLPLEVFQTITRHMDARTFHISLLTCKHFLKAANCRPNILRHLHSLPGLRLGLDDLSDPDLLLRFRKRAAESGCAAGILADITKYQQTSRTSLSNAVFSPANTSHPGSQSPYVATVHDDSIVHVYDLGKHHVRLKAELHIRPEDGDVRRMEIVKMAFATGSRDLAVLYRHLPRTSKPNTRTKMFGHEYSRKIVYKLVTFHFLLARTKGYFYDSHQQETKDLVVSDIEVPVGLALAANGYACVAWKDPSPERATGVTLIGRNEKLMQACNYDANPKTLGIAQPPGICRYDPKERRIYSIQFAENDRKLNFYQPGNPVHSWYTVTCSPHQEECNPVLMNSAIIINETFRHTDFEVGMPFHGEHFENVMMDDQSAPESCQTSYLALGITRGNYQGSDQRHALIVQATCYDPARSCTHEISLDDGRKLLIWKAVALLAGWRMGESSLGTVVATSPNGTRVAAATWSRILVWSFNPSLIHQGELQHYFPVRDYNEEKEFGRLRPTMLTPEGVVHKMIWIDETSLYATTDRGLVRWDIGHKSDGERDEMTLTYDAWPDTAVAIPAMPPR